MQINHCEIHHLRGSTSCGVRATDWVFEGVLLNTGISRAIDPLLMASASSASIQAGRAAYLAGPMLVQTSAVASTPEIGRTFAGESVSSRWADLPSSAEQNLSRRKRRLKVVRQPLQKEDYR